MSKRLERDFDAVIVTPFSRFGLTVGKRGLLETNWVSDETPLKSSQNSLIRQAEAAIQAYCGNSHYSFNLSLQLEGTPFQQRVWAALQSIPPGSTMTYGELAESLRTSPRAVGNACRANPIPLIVPCHRIVSVSGLGDYSGAGSEWLLGIKRNLLLHEGVEIS